MSEPSEKERPIRNCAAPIAAVDASSKGTRPAKKPPAVTKTSPSHQSLRRVISQSARRRAVALDEAGGDHDEGHLDEADAHRGQQQQLLVGDSRRSEGLWSVVYLMNAWSAGL